MSSTTANGAAAAAGPLRLARHTAKHAFHFGNLVVWSRNDKTAIVGACNDVFAALTGTARRSEADADHGADVVVFADLLTMLGRGKTCWRARAASGCARRGSSWLRLWSSIVFGGVLRRYRPRRRPGNHRCACRAPRSSSRCEPVAPPAVLRWRCRVFLRRLAGLGRRSRRSRAGVGGQNDR